MTRSPRPPVLNRNANGKGNIRVLRNAAGAPRYQVRLRRTQVGTFDTRREAEEALARAIAAAAAAAKDGAA